jgi:CBS domain containing-hemolysin-like protein
LSTPFLEHIFLLLILLSTSFFFSGSETAIFSLPRVVVDRLKQASMSGRHLAEMLEAPNRLLVTILVGNLAVNIAISALIGTWVLHLFERLHYSVYLGGIAAVLLTTTVLLLLAEITPKTIAINNAERFATGVAFPLHLFSKAVYPLIRAVLFLTDSILSLFGIRKNERDIVMTEEELRTLVAMGVEEGVLESSEHLMIQRIIEFGDTLVRDVYVPRTDMVRVKSNITVEELTSIMKETGHSRFPVYGKTVDDIKGIVYAKDLFPYFWRGQIHVPISHFIRPAYYVPETKKVSDLLREFQSGRLHMAIVVDERGGTAGLVTLEDLIEEVVGEIFDEYDVRKREAERLPDGRLRVEARLRLDVLSDILGVDMRAGDCDTVGGLVHKLLKHLPTPNEHVEHKGFKFLVEEVRNRRIRTVRITRVSSDTSEHGGEVTF